MKKKIKENTNIIVNYKLVQEVYKSSGNGYKAIKTTNLLTKRTMEEILNALLERDK